MPSEGLGSLPFELLDLVVSNFDSASSLFCLSLTCRRFDHYTRSHGYRAFCKGCFPCLQSSLDWQATARILVALSRAWERKAFLARDLCPVRSGTESLRLIPKTSRSQNNNLHGTEIRSKQSMGYQPAIDCVGGYASTSTCVLAWGAGAEVVVRVIEENKGSLRWMFWQDPELLDGKDDITSLSFSNLASAETDQEYRIIIGRASRRLEHLTIADNGCTVQKLDTCSRDVRSAHVSQGVKPLIAAGLDGDVVLYDLLSASTPTETQVELPVFAGDQGVSTWTVRFVNNLRIGVGRGPANPALCIFDVTPDSILPGSNIYSKNMDSVYAIEPLASSSDSGQLFLAGWYSGIITLHDLRMPGNVVRKYEDPIDSGSAVYSLCSFANDRFLAGGGRHSCVKAFDLRFSGRREYGSYNLFLDSPGRRTRPSPIYSISKASTYASSFFVGLEDRVVQLDLCSLTDESIKPSGSVPLLAYGSDLLQKEPTRRQDEIKLALVEHTSSGAHSIWTQDFGDRRRAIAPPGWDACWIPSTTDNSRSHNRPAEHNGWMRSQNLQRSTRRYGR